MDIESLYDVFLTNCLSIRHGREVTTSSSNLLDLVHNPNCWRVCLHFILSSSYSNDETTLFLASQILRKTVQIGWESFSASDQTHILEVRV